MSALRRFYVSFVVLFNIVGFGIVFLVISNSTRVDDLVYLANSDAVFAIVVAIVGVIANIGLTYVLWLGSVRTRRLEAERGLDRRSRITGE